MPTLLTAGDATTGAVITSGSDGIIKIQTGPAGAKVDALTIDAAGNITVLGALTAAASVFDNSAAATDVALLLGQTAYYDLTAATSKALKIACADNQAYEVSITGAGNAGSVLGNFAFIQPNGSSYTNSFRHEYAQGSGATVGQQSAWVSGLIVGCMDVRNSVARVSTKTSSKNSIFYGLGYDGTTLRSFSGGCAWQASSSSVTVGDTSTTWTSLGTLTFPVAMTGRVYVKRVA
jgi:hypothetical protein